MPGLFDPITLRGITFRNRIWLSPMCQYSAADGVPTDWHLAHLGARAIGGFGLVMTEATAVVPEGRISPQDTGLWTDGQATAWRRIVDFVHGQGASAGVQLAHAGRKASTYAPWRGTGSVAAADGGWRTVAPSPIAHGEHTAPHALSRAEIRVTVDAFAAATRRADAAGFDVVELHGAHGYLLHQFLSPITNRRTDTYGGSFDNRIRFVLEVVDAVRAVWPVDKPLIMRISATDWIDGGWSTVESIDLARILRERGVDLIDVSTGGLDPAQRITVAPGYQVPFARDVKVKAEVPTGAVGLITEPAQAQQILDESAADVVYLARAALRDPGWPLRAAHELGIPAAGAPYPPQYLRGAWRG